ncbi:hypothetical protein ACFL96_15415, partial [Thermoproteota archaeon]
QEKLKKLNMIIGVFFSEVGTDLISYFSVSDPQAGDIQKKLLLNVQWTPKLFLSTRECLAAYNYNITITKEDVIKLRQFLLSKRDFLLGLLANPNLFEHDAFTDLLWAVFHLTEELLHRERIKECSEKDLEHIQNDIKRAYCILVKEWLVYMQHLQLDYPYLFSLAVRTNPFDRNAKPEFV